MSTQLQNLYARRDQEWQRLLERSPFVKGVMSDRMDRRLFGIYLVETYHYVIHNPKHQALVGTRAEPLHPNYRKFCFEHAAEETGHELMALHDLCSLGGLREGEFTLSEPLFETELLNAYLYRISVSGNPLRRLGYSFWAEDAYHYIGELIARTRRALDLSDAQMTFLIAHANIDAQHSKDVARMLETFCASDQDWHDVETVMCGSLRLQAGILDAVWDEFKNIRDGGAGRYGYLNALV